MPATAAAGFQNATDIIIDMNTLTTNALETFSFTTTRSGKITDITVIAKADQAGGSIEVRNGGNVVATGLACVTNKTITRATSIDTAFQAFASGAVITVRVSTAGTQGLIIIHTEPTQYANQTTLTAA